MLTTAIVPVAVYPSEANTLAIRSITLGPPPQYYYELQEILFDPEFNSHLEVLKSGNVSMTEEQWNDWPAGLGPDGDEEYQLDCIAANLGLTRASKTDAAVDDENARGGNKGGNGPKA